jgi:N-acetylmuramoyl-L-alanine amidase
MQVLQEKTVMTRMFKLALDAGHGINTAGKRCMKALDSKETREWTLNSRVANYIEEYLKDYEGYSVLRVDDKDDGKTDIQKEKNQEDAGIAVRGSFLSGCYVCAGIFRRYEREDRQSRLL